VDDPVVALHRGGERAHVAGVGMHDVEPGIGEVRFVMPLASDEKLSKMVTRRVFFDANSASAKWLPMKPAPPMIK